MAFYDIKIMVFHYKMNYDKINCRTGSIDTTVAVLVSMWVPSRVAHSIHR
jgi:hypothetical protein